jgi:hypothetical protein
VDPTTPGAALAELLARIGAAAAGTVELTAGELQRWPDAVVTAFKAQRLLLPTAPGETATCPGCERACVMPVEWAARGSKGRRPFIVCDKRDDIERVPLDELALVRWLTGMHTLADAVAALLAGDAAAAAVTDAGRWRVGRVTGGRAAGTAHLGCEAGRPVVMVAGHTIDAELLLSLRDGRMALDVRRLAQCADQPLEGGTAAESPSQRRARLLARKSELRRQGVTAFNKRLAAEEGISLSMLKKILAREQVTDKPPADAIGAIAAWAKGDPPLRKRKR